MWRISWSNSIIRWQDYRVAALRLAESNFRHTQDVVGNMPLVWSFCGIGREHSRLDATIDREMAARRRSLLYLEKLRLFHAVVTVVLIIGLLAWAIVLWQNGAATAGDVVLVCTLGLSILQATRDLAVALVDVTQHLARLSEALATLLVPHGLRDHPEATSLVRSGTVALENIDFCYPDGRRVFSNFSLRIEPGQRVGLVGQSGCGKSTLFVLLQRFYDVQGGRIVLGGQDLARVTQESLRAAIAVVPQDISLFHRSIMENIRYGRPDASDADVQEAIVAANCGDFIENLPEGARQRVGRSRPPGIGSLDGRPDRHRNRASAVELAQFRSDRRVAGGTGLRGRPAAGAGAKQRCLLQSGAARGSPAGETGCLARNTASSQSGATVGFKVVDLIDRLPVIAQAQ